MQFSRARWICIATALHIIPTALILYFCCRVFASPESQKTAIVTYTLDKTFFPRSLSDAAKGLSTAIPKVPDIVNSAVAAGETAVAGAAGKVLKNVPTGFSVGTKLCCVTYSSHDDCTSLPLRSAFLNELARIPQLSSLVAILRHLPAPEVFLAIGLGCVLISSLTSVLRCFLPRLWTLSIACSVLGSLFLWTFSVLTWVILNLGPNVGVKHQGAAYVSSIGNALSTISHLIVCVASIWYLKV